MQMCVACGIEEVPAEKVNKNIARCNKCHAEYKKLSMRSLRLKKKMELLNKATDDDNRRVCGKCLRHKLKSEFSAARGKEEGKLRKICDTCLTSIYTSKSRKSEGFDNVYWRKRAYTTNTAGRQKLASKKEVKVSQIKLSDLEYICKPQDLAELFDKQNGQCYFCKVILTPNMTSVDHLVPLSKGGEHAPINFGITCIDCNRLKHTRNEVEFLNFLQEYTQRIQVIEHANKELHG